MTSPVFTPAHVQLGVAFGAKLGVEGFHRLLHLENRQGGVGGVVGVGDGGAVAEHDPVAHERVNQALVLADDRDHAAHVAADDGHGLLPKRFAEAREALQVGEADGHQADLAFQAGNLGVLDDVIDEDRILVRAKTLANAAVLDGFGDVAGGSKMRPDKQTGDDRAGHADDAVVVVVEKFSIDEQIASDQHERRTAAFPGGRERDNEGNHQAEEGGDDIADVFGRTREEPVGEDGVKDRAVSHHAGALRMDRGGGVINVSGGGPADENRLAADFVRERGLPLRQLLLEKLRLAHQRRQLVPNACDDFHRRAARISLFLLCRELLISFDLRLEEGIAEFFADHRQPRGRVVGIERLGLEGIGR